MDISNNSFHSFLQTFLTRPDEPWIFIFQIVKLSLYHYILKIYSYHERVTSIR